MGTRIGLIEADLHGFFEHPHLVEQASGRYQFATSHLPDGMYFLQVTNGKGDVEALRFVVQH